MTESNATAESRVWFITGCSTGFGRELAKAVLDHGDRVVVTARNVEQVQDFEQSGPELARAVRLDVTDPEEVSEAVDAALDAFGRIDALVNNAGYGSMGAIEEVEEDEIRRQFEVNVFGVLNVTRAVLPHMRERRQGHVVNISSVGGFVGVPGFGIFNGTKFASETAECGLEMSHSNGQVEGQIHKLKLLNRQAYGRAGFDLLKRRVLGAA